MYKRNKCLNEGKIFNEQKLMRIKQNMKKRATVWLSITSEHSLPWQHTAMTKVINQITKTTDILY